MLRQGNKNDCQRLYDAFWDKQESFFTWGNENLDEALPLITEDQLVIVAGSQGSGKTTWTIEMALENARRGQEGGYGVGYLSLEVSPENVLKRMVERRFNITKEDRRKGAIFSLASIQEKQMESTKMFEEFISSGLMFFQKNPDDDLRLIESIRTICTDPYGPKLLFIDNLNEIISDENTEYDRMDSILRQLSDLRRNTNTTIVLIHHFAKPKIGEQLSINSIKGNNIVVTKADVTVAIDKQDIPNPNWACHDFDEGDNLVDKNVRKRFMEYAPTIQTRGIYVFKDRYYGDEGLKGYMELRDGKIQFLTEATIKMREPLTDADDVRLRAAYNKFGLKPPVIPQEDNQETLIFN